MNHNPQLLLGLSNIMRLAFNGDDLSQVTRELVARVEAGKGVAAAMLDLSIVHQLNGQHQTGLELQWQALQQQQHYRLRSNPLHPAVRVLAIMGPGEVMANTPIEFLLEDSDIALDLLYVGAGLPPVHDIPKHDVAFVAVCESDCNQQLLKQLDGVMQFWPKPHLNRPLQIAKLSRDGLSDWLAGIEGVDVVASRRVGRDELVEQLMRELKHGPAVVRPANSHAGHGLKRIEQMSDFDDYLAAHDEDEFSIAPFIEYRSRHDNLYRKYRVACIAGRAYPAHMALSPRWMVHYLNADMLENADNRAVEGNFMDSFDWEFGERHSRALAAIDARVGLDYYSIDCSETPDGSLLVFELDSGAVVHAMDSIELFPYKRPHMQKLFSAFHGLVKRTAWGTPAETSTTGRRRRMAA